MQNASWENANDHSDPVMSIGYKKILSIYSC
jgi:hypothetical protein